MNLESPAFAPNSTIPARYTADGDDVSPPLKWSDVPAEAKSLALVIDDPDAPDPAHPRRTWVHWVVVDLPVELDHLEAHAELPPGAHEGRNDFKQTGYSGPAPPIGRHRYVHKLYALDCTLPALKHPTKAELESAMRGHVLAEARLVGTYARS